LATTSTASTYRSDKGKGKGKFKPRQAFSTEATELEAVPEDGEEQQDDGMRTMSLMTMPKTATEMMPRIQTKSKMNQKLILEKLPKF
jgi:hypothetical protein